MSYYAKSHIIDMDHDYNQGMMQVFRETRTFFVTKIVNFLFNWMEKTMPCYNYDIAKAFGGQKAKGESNSGHSRRTTIKIWTYKFDFIF